MARVAGFTSTGSKRPEALFGAGAGRLATPDGLAAAAAGFSGDDGREYLDCIMALGAVALGYGHPEVRDAVVDAVERGGIGSGTTGRGGSRSPRISSG